MSKLSLLLPCVAWALLTTTVQPVAAVEQLRVEISGTDGALWIDIGQQRFWVEGDCDGGGRPLLQVSGEGEQMTIEFEVELRLDFSRHPFTTEQLFHLEIEGDHGRLRLRSAQGLAELEVPVTIERHEDRRACSGGKDRRK